MLLGFSWMVGVFKERTFCPAFKLILQQQCWMKLKTKFKREDAEEMSQKLHKQAASLEPDDPKHTGQC